MEFLLLGVIAGTIAGFVPGVGIFATLLVLFPWLADQSIVDTFVFYIALASTTQYVGSISATYFAVPGEVSSLPAVKEGNALFKKVLRDLAISGSSLGSVLVAFIVLGLAIIAAPYMDIVYLFFNTYIQSLVLIGVMLMMILFSNNKIIISFLLTLFGFYLGTVGCNSSGSYVDGICNMPIDHPDISTGLPFISVVAAIFVFPKLLETFQPKFQNSHKKERSSILYHLTYFIKNIGCSIRGTVVGFFLGFTPGSSTMLASNTAHKLEAAKEKRKGTYEEGNYRALVSAETANNAAQFTTLVPLFVLGLPFAASEALFYNIITAKGFMFTSDFDISFFISIIAYNLIIVNILAFFIAWPFAKYIALIYKVPQKLINLIIFCILAFVIWELGSAFWQSEYYLIVFLVFLPLGYLLRKFDTTPLIFSFLLWDKFYMSYLTTSDLVSHWF